MWSSIVFKPLQVPLQSTSWSIEEALNYLKLYGGKTLEKKQKKNTFSPNRLVTNDCFEFGFVSWTLTFHIFQNQVFFPNPTASITWATITSLKLLFDIQERKVISQPSVSLLNCPISNEKFFPTWASLDDCKPFGHYSWARPEINKYFQWFTWPVASYSASQKIFVSTRQHI